MTCVITPYSLAFPEDYKGTILYVDYLMNVLFFIDVIVNFFSAYVDSDFNLVDDPKVNKIKINLWFLVDREKLPFFMVLR